MRLVVVDLRDSYKEKERGKANNHKMRSQVKLALNVPHINAGECFFSKHLISGMKCKRH